MLEELQVYRVNHPSFSGVLDHLLQLIGIQPLSESSNNANKNDSDKPVQSATGAIDSSINMLQQAHKPVITVNPGTPIFVPHNMYESNMGTAGFPSQHSSGGSIQRNKLNDQEESVRSSNKRQKILHQQQQQQQLLHTWHSVPFQKQVRSNNNVEQGFLITQSSINSPSAATPYLPTHGNSYYNRLQTSQGNNFHYNQGSGSSNNPYNNTQKKIQVSVLQSEQDLVDFQAMLQNRPNPQKIGSSNISPQQSSSNKQSSSQYGSNRNPGKTTRNNKITRSQPPVKQHFKSQQQFPKPLSSNPHTHTNTNVGSPIGTTTSNPTSFHNLHQHNNQHHHNFNSLQQYSSTSFGGNEQAIFNSQWLRYSSGNAKNQLQEVQKQLRQRNHQRFQSVRSRSQQMRAHRLSIKWKLLQKAQQKLNRGKQALKAEKKARLQIQQKLAKLTEQMHVLQHKLEHGDLGAGSRRNNNQNFVEFNNNNQQFQDQISPKSNQNSKKISFLQQIFRILSQSQNPLDELQQLKQLLFLSNYQNNDSSPLILLNERQQQKQKSSQIINSQNLQKQFGSIRTSQQQQSSAAASPGLSRYLTQQQFHIFTSQNTTPQQTTQAITPINRSSKSASGGGGLLRNTLNGKKKRNDNGTRDHSTCTTTNAPHSPIPSTTVTGSRQISPGQMHSGKGTNRTFIKQRGGGEGELQLIDKLNSQLQDNMQMIQELAKEIGNKNTKICLYKQKMREGGLVLTETDDNVEEEDKESRSQNNYSKQHQIMKNSLKQSDRFFVSSKKSRNQKGKAQVSSKNNNKNSINTLSTNQQIEQQIKQKQPNSNKHSPALVSLSSNPDTTTLFTNPNYNKTNNTHIDTRSIHTPYITSAFPTRKVTAATNTTSRAQSRQLGLGTTGSIQLISCCSSSKSPCQLRSANNSIGNNASNTKPNSRTSNTCIQSNQQQSKLKNLTPTGVAAQNLLKGFFVTSTDRKQNKYTTCCTTTNDQIDPTQYNTCVNHNKFQPGEFILQSNNSVSSPNKTSLSVIKQDSNGQFLQNGRPSPRNQIEDGFLTSQMLQSVFRSAAKNSQNLVHSNIYNNQHYPDESKRQTFYEQANKKYDESLKYSSVEQDEISYQPPSSDKGFHLNNKKRIKQQFYQHTDDDVSGQMILKPNHLRFSSHASTQQYQLTTGRRDLKLMMLNTERSCAQSSNSKKSELSSKKLVKSVKKHPKMVKSASAGEDNVQFADYQQQSKNKSRKYPRVSEFDVNIQKIVPNSVDSAVKKKNIKLGLNLGDLCSGILSSKGLMNNNNNNKDVKMQQEKTPRNNDILNRNIHNPNNNNNLNNKLSDQKQNTAIWVGEKKKQQQIPLDNKQKYERVVQKKYGNPQISTLVVNLDEERLMYVTPRNLKQKDS